MQQGSSSSLTSCTQQESSSSILSHNTLLKLLFLGNKLALAGETSLEAASHKGPSFPPLLAVEVYWRPCSPDNWHPWLVTVPCGISGTLPKELWFCEVLFVNDWRECRSCRTRSLCCGMAWLGGWCCWTWFGLAFWIPGYGSWDAGYVWCWGCLNAWGWWYVDVLELTFWSGWDIWG